MKFSPRLFFLCILSLPIAVKAGQDPRILTKAIDDFLRIQIRGLPGNASYSIGTISNSERLNACQNLQVGLPQGGRLWGKSNVLVRCEDTPGWTLYVPVKIKVVGNYLVTSRVLQQGQVITVDDVATQSGDLAELPSGTITDVQQAVGRTVSMSVTIGHPLRNDLLRQVTLVKQGQTVKVVSRGQGFEVANEGEALNNGSQGQVVRVRLGNGQLISGVADGPGIVNVSN